MLDKILDYRGLDKINIQKTSVSGHLGSYLSSHLY